MDEWISNLCRHIFYQDLLIVLVIGPFNFRGFVFKIVNILPWSQSGGRPVPSNSSPLKLAPLAEEGVEPHVYRCYKLLRQLNLVSEKNNAAKVY